MIQLACNFSIISVFIPSATKHSRFFGLILKLSLVWVHFLVASSYRQVNNQRIDMQGWFVAVRQSFVRRAQQIVNIMLSDYESSRVSRNKT